MVNAQSTTPIQPTAQPGNVETTATSTAYPTVEQVMRVCPDSNINNVRQNLPFVLKAMAAAGLVSRNQLIAIVATIYTETTPWAPIREFGRGRGYSYPPYFGRGFVQLTWKSNYEAAEKALNIPGLVANPDKALEPEAAARILTWYWKGGPGNASAVPYAESGDWDNVRSIINAGRPGRISRCHGVPVYRAAIQRGLQVFTQGIDPAAIGALPVDGSYGLGCADPGAASARVLAGVHNPSTQGDALTYALGLHALDSQRSHEFEATLNVYSQPRIMTLDAQKTFEVKGIGEDLDGEYTTDEIFLYPLASGGLQAKLFGFKPDPNAPAPQVFLHDTTQGLTPPQTTPATTPIATGDIPPRIFAASQAARGRSSRSGPGGGRVSCAWATNLFCIIPAGLQNIGNIRGQDNVTVSVREMVKALEGGRGQRVERLQAVPGDIWVSPGQRHIGVVTTARATRVLSNSSSKATFSWEDSIDDVNGFYGRGQEHGIYRVLN